MAKTFAAYLDGENDRDTLLMLLHAINISSIQDLQTFITQEKANAIDNSNFVVERLAATGLYRVVGDGSLSGGGISYEIAPPGMSLMEVIEHSERNHA